MSSKNDSKFIVEYTHYHDFVKTDRISPKNERKKYDFFEIEKNQSGFHDSGSVEVVLLVFAYLPIFYHFCIFLIYHAYLVLQPEFSRKFSNFRL